MSVWTRVLLVLHALAPFFRSSALMIGIYFDVLAAADARGALARRRGVRLVVAPLDSHFRLAVLRQQLCQSDGRLDARATN